MKTLTKTAIGAGLVAITLAALFDPAHWLMPGHVTPEHRKIESDCLACHAPFRGTPAQRCVDCHDPRALTPAVAAHADRAAADIAKPAGTAHISVAELHRLLPLDDCASCHVGHLTATRAARNPAFDHAQYFPLEGPHAVACKTCHVGKGLSTYTCMGCHEHSPERVARQHAEEGIRRDLSDCVACHRDGTEHGGRRDTRGDSHEGPGRGEHD
jgi:hypothetical protein